MIVENYAISGLMLDKELLYTRPHSGSYWYFHALSFNRTDTEQRIKKILANNQWGEHTQIGVIAYTTGQEIRNRLEHDHPITILVGNHAST